MSRKDAFGDLSRGHSSVTDFKMIEMISQIIWGMENHKSPCCWDFVEKMLTRNQKQEILDQ